MPSFNMLISSDSREPTQEKSQRHVSYMENSPVIVLPLENTTELNAGEGFMKDKYFFTEHSLY